MLAAVAAGVLVPELAVVTDYATPILAVMVGSVSLTLTVDRFRTVEPRGVAGALAGHVAMPAVASAVASALDLAPAVVAGFVVLGAVTPELVTPTMTELADGDTALAMTVLVVAGVGATAFVPLAAFLGDAVAVDSARIVEGLVLAVVAPMLAAIVVQHAFDERVGAHEDAYGTVSAVAVVAIIGGVAAANADLLRATPARTAVVAFGALALNLAGYAIGYLGGLGGTRETRIATTLSVGMRDFAVAAALVVAAGFPTAASLPAVTFGVVEMTTSALLASRLG
ncbi:bile acid:sodium symporter family protein [Halorubellus salinus]|uniref:bile acid:sodium symporter family protein n=1 Tax=Halorubellus salinus TaxID=755309 RepID=UPI001D074067